MMLIGVFFLALLNVGGTFILDENHHGRNVVQIISVNNGGPWGDWGGEEMCPAGSYASGYTMKIERNKGSSDDDTSLNAIKLVCTERNDMSTRRGIVSSSQGLYGDWTDEVHCATQQFLTGFQMQVEGQQGDGDDTAANFVAFLCRTYSGSGSEVPLSPPPHHGHFGTWGSWSKCPAGSAVCGIKTRVEGPQGYHDDTALNDAVFYCCND